MEVKLKRYMLFRFSTYYPSGGWNDFVASFDTLDEAVAHINSTINTGEFGGDDDWCNNKHIIDRDTLDRVYHDEEEDRP